MTTQNRNLSKRENEVVGLLLLGKSNKQMAVRLGIAGGRRPSRRLEQALELLGGDHVRRIELGRTPPCREQWMQEGCRLAVHRQRCWQTAVASPDWGDAIGSARD